MILCVQWNTDYGLVLPMLLLLALGLALGLRLGGFSPFLVLRPLVLRLLLVSRVHSSSYATSRHNAIMARSHIPNRLGVFNSFTVGSSSFQCANSTFHVFRLSAAIVFLPLGLSIGERHSFGTDSAVQDLCRSCLLWNGLFSLLI